jgi:succinyl-diaminopimelate desuccinylase
MRSPAIRNFDKDEVFKILKENRVDLVSTLRDFVKIDTQVPPGLNYDVFCEALSGKLTSIGLESSVYEASEKYLDMSGAEHLKLEGPRSNLVARLKGMGGGPTMHISAHIDTAPIQADGWSHDPLGGDLTDSSPYGRSSYDSGGGHIWGRGVCDDKGPLAAAVLAIQAIRQGGVKLRGDLVLTANCDEEIGGVAGLGYLIREGIVQADYGLQLDGDLKSINLAAQGRTRFLIRTFGKAYHGQVPILGVNAIEKMSKINVALTRYWRNVLLMRNVETPGIELPHEVRDVGIDRLTPMLNIGTIRGGVQGATVPDLCEEEVLRCMTPDEDPEEVHRELVRVIEGVRATDSDLRYEVDVINSRGGYVVAACDPYAQEAQGIIDEVTGRTLPFSANLGSVDMNYQVVDGGMPCINISVGDTYTNYHKRDENVSVDELVELSKVIALFIIRKLA